MAKIERSSPPGGALLRLYHSIFVLVHSYDALATAAASFYIPYNRIENRVLQLVGLNLHASPLTVNFYTAYRWLVRNRIPTQMTTVLPRVSN